MAVSVRKKPNFYLSSAHAVSTRTERKDELLLSIALSCAAIILFALALWLMISPPLAQTGASQNNSSASVTVPGTYAPVEQLPTTGAGPVVDETYLKTVR